MSVTLNNLEEMGPQAAFDTPQQGTKRGNNGPPLCSSHSVEMYQQATDGHSGTTYPVLLGIVLPFFAYAKSFLLKSMAGTKGPLATQ
jgi:hypothetical protein